MHTIDTIIPAVEAFAARHGVLPSTVVRKATGNPRLYDRLKDRAARVEEDIARIARFMADNQSVDVLPDDGSPVGNNDGDCGATVASGENVTPGGAA